MALEHTKNIDHVFASEGALRHSLEEVGQYLHTVIEDGGPRAVELDNGDGVTSKSEEFAAAWADLDEGGYTATSGWIYTWYRGPHGSQEFAARIHFDGLSVSGWVKGFDAKKVAQAAKEIAAILSR
ncbi:hypothetical protein NYS55_05215 [Curtobacterium flaccumfaciens pv. flaccumfaciens]|uniref:hypothetical protein n=1 Tax=Curtobacterium flaccumfaciens TaxID=2035 RepID=UPI00217D5854|nr:hypothetical protein [Curtobacterium flaccumfaciens]MCS6550822.1 hypothetical protein [Curtobacterium flaccumfaciens pv. flaccumfaciens]